MDFLRVVMNPTKDLAFAHADPVEPLTPIVPKRHLWHIVVASAKAVPPKTEFQMVHVARGIAW